MKIDIWHFAGKSPYQRACYQSQALGRALQDLGVHVRHSDEESHDIRAHVQRLWHDPPDWTLSFGYTAFRDKMLSHLSIPHLHILWQEPYGLTKREHYGAFASEILCQGQSSLYVPPAIIWPERNMTSPRDGIAFFGSYLDQEALLERLPYDFSPFLCQRLQEGIERCLQGAAPGEALALERNSPQLLGVNLQALLLVLDYLARAEAMKRMLELVSGQKVAIYGSTVIPDYFAPYAQGSWKRWIKKYPLATYHGPVPASELSHFMARYALILDPTPPYAGISERLLEGLAAGCLVLAYKNPELLRYFGRGKGVIYVGESEMPQDITAGQSIVRNAFTYQVRAQELIHALP